MPALALEPTQKHPEAREQMPSRDGNYSEEEGRRAALRPELERVQEQTNAGLVRSQLGELAKCRLQETGSG